MADRHVHPRRNISQMILFDGMQDLLLESGYRLFTTNSQAALSWRELGLSAATLYVEDDRENFSALLGYRYLHYDNENADNSVGVTASGP